MPFRRTHRRRKNSQYSIAKKTVQKELRKLIEVKKYHFGQAAIPVSNTGALYKPLEGIDVGVNNDERVGNNINLLSMALRFNLLNGDANNTVRLFVCETYLPQTAAATLFNQYTLLGGINSSWDREIVKKVYMDKVVNLNTYWDGARIYKYKKGYCRFSKTGEKVTYVGHVSNDVSSKHLIVGLMSDSGVSTHPAVTMSIEIRYSDL